MSSIEINATKIAFLSQIIGEDEAEKVVGAAVGKTKELEAAGVRHKSAAGKFASGKKDGSMGVVMAAPAGASPTSFDELDDEPDRRAAAGLRDRSGGCPGLAGRGPGRGARRGGRDGRGAALAAKSSYGGAAPREHHSKDRRLC